MTTPKRLLSLFATLAILAPLTTESALAVPDGGYIAIGIGGAVASGDRGVRLEEGDFTGRGEDSDYYKETVRTDFGSGMAFELRFGYLFTGIIAPEISLMGHGNFKFEDGAGSASFILRYHPVQHFIDHEQRSWDLNLYGGVGFAIGGYKPNPAIGDDDSKGWRGWGVQAGFGGDYQVSKGVSLGVDLRFSLPQYRVFMIDRNDGIEATPVSTPSTLLIIPTFQALFHF